MNNIVLDQIEARILLQNNGNIHNSILMDVLDIATFKPDMLSAQVTVLNGTVISFGRNRSNLYPKGTKFILNKMNFDNHQKLSIKKYN